jgi:hypothetical protein
VGTIKAIICSVICGVAIYLNMTGYIIKANWLMLLWIAVLISEPNYMFKDKNK